jgi:hypothetical protein
VSGICLEFPTLGLQADFCKLKSVTDLQLGSALEIREAHQKNKEESERKKERKKERRKKNHPYVITLLNCSWA